MKLFNHIKPYLSVATGLILVFAVQAFALSIHLNQEAYQNAFELGQLGRLLPFAEIAMLMAAAACFRARTIAGFLVGIVCGCLWLTVCSLNTAGEYMQLETKCSKALRPLTEAQAELVKSSSLDSSANNGDKAAAETKLANLKVAQATACAAIQSQIELSEKIAADELAEANIELKTNPGPRFRAHMAEVEKARSQAAALRNELKELQTKQAVELQQTANEGIASASHKEAEAIANKAKLEAQVQSTVDNFNPYLHTLYTYFPVGTDVRRVTVHGYEISLSRELVHAAMLLTLSILLTLTPSAGVLAIEVSGKRREKKVKVAAETIEQPVVPAPVSFGGIKVETRKVSFIDRSEMMRWVHQRIKEIRHEDAKVSRREAMTQALKEAHAARQHEQQVGA